MPPAVDEARRRLEAFLEEELLPAERRHAVEDEGDTSPELRRWVRTRAEALGLFRLAQPAEVGGGGLGPLGRVTLHETIGASGSVLGRFVLGGDGGLLKRARGAQRERFLTPVLRGELTAAFAYTDPQEGPRTTAIARDGGFAVRGVKSFVTDGVHADLLLVVATVTDNPGGPTGPAVFVIPRAAPGVTLRRQFRTLDGGAHGEFDLADVQVPAADVLGTIGEGIPAARESITALRLTVAATACGTARWALEEMLARAARPHRSGTRLGDREHVQGMIADSATDLFAARSALHVAARLAEAGAPVQTPAAMAKVLATEAVTRIVDRAIQMAGGAAVIEGHPLARAYRRVRAWRIAEGTTEAVRLLVGRALLAPRAGVGPGWEACGGASRTEGSG